MESARVLLMGLGNPLRGADGFGVALLEFLLANYQLPKGVATVAAGTQPLAYYPLIASCDWLILLDAVSLGDSASDAAEDHQLIVRDPFLLSQPCSQEHEISSHGLNADSLLSLLATLGQEPARVSLLGLVVTEQQLAANSDCNDPTLMQQAVEKLSALLTAEGMDLSWIQPHASAEILKTEGP